MLIEFHHLGSQQIVNALIVDRYTPHAEEDFLKIECEIWIFCQAF